jgi:hypothetical protein
LRTQNSKEGNTILKRFKSLMVTTGRMLRKSTSLCKSMLLKPYGAQLVVPLPPTKSDHFNRSYNAITLFLGSNGWDTLWWLVHLVLLTILELNYQLVFSVNWLMSQWQTTLMVADTIWLVVSVFSRIKITPKTVHKKTLKIT